MGEMIIWQCQSIPVAALCPESRRLRARYDLLLAAVFGIVFLLLGYPIFYLYLIVLALAQIVTLHAAAHRNTRRTQMLVSFFDIPITLLFCPIIFIAYGKRILLFYLFFIVPTVLRRIISWCKHKRDDGAPE